MPPLHQLCASFYICNFIRLFVNNVLPDYTSFRAIKHGSTPSRGDVLLERGRNHVEELKEKKQENPWQQIQGHSSTAHGMSRVILPFVGFTPKDKTMPKAPGRKSLNPAFEGQSPRDERHQRIARLCP